MCPGSDARGQRDVALRPDAGGAALVVSAGGAWAHLDRTEHHVDACGRQPLR